MNKKEEGIQLMCHNQEGNRREAHVEVSCTIDYVSSPVEKGGTFVLDLSVRMIRKEMGKVFDGVYQKKKRP